MPAFAARETTAEQAAAQAGSGVTFALRLGLALHRYGTPAHRLEEMMSGVCRQLGLEARFFSTPTAIFASFGPPEDLRTCLIRADPGDLDLERLALLDHITTKVVRGQLSAEDGVARVDAVLAARQRYGPLPMALAYAVAAGAGARLFGGSTREALVAAVASLGVGVLAVAGVRRPALGRVLVPLAAIGVSALTVVAAHWLGPLSPRIAMLAGLLVLLPGLTLTISITELSTLNLISGTSRLVGAGLVFLQLGFGMALGGRLDLLLPARHGPPVAPQAWTQWPALAVTTLALGVIFRARPRDHGWLLVAGALAYGGSRLGAGLMGPELGAFLGALLLAMGSNALARWRDRPSLVTLLPGIMLLVPGSIGFHSMESLLARNVLAGVDTAFTMIMVAVGLAAGLLLANLAVPPRKTL